jgi:hypothetical protein
VADAKPEQPFERFKALTKKLVAVPKQEIDARRPASKRRQRRPKTAS